MSKAATRCTRGSSSNYTASQFDLLNTRMEQPLATNQVEFNLLHHDPIHDGAFHQCEKLGVSPMAFVCQRRIREAERLLAQGHLSMKEVAARLNFADPQHFSRVFKRVTGISPSEYAGGAAPLRARESGQYATAAR